MRCHRTSPRQAETEGQPGKGLRAQAPCKREKERKEKTWRCATIATTTPGASVTQCHKHTSLRTHAMHEVSATEEEGKHGASGLIVDVHENDEMRRNAPRVNTTRGRARGYERSKQRTEGQNTGMSTTRSGMPRILGKTARKTLTTSAPGASAMRKAHAERERIQTEQDAKAEAQTSQVFVPPSLKQWSMST